MKKIFIKTAAATLAALMLMSASCSKKPDDTESTSGTSATEAQSTEPETTGSETTGSETTEPETTASETTEPETTEPETTEPETTEPETTEPETTEPETTEPETTEPETTAPETTAPETTAPQTTEPETTKKPDPDPASEEYSTENGLKYTASGYSKVSGTTFTLTKDLVLTFDRAFTSEFNRMSFTYSSGKPLKITVRYNQNGVKADNFFLEAGERVTFNGLVSSYLSNGKGKGLVSVTVSTCDGKSTAFTLHSGKAELVKVYNDKLYYIESDRFKVGIQLSWGGGLNYIEDKQCPVSGLSNLVNRHDTGRLIQQSYYGTGGNSQYQPGSFNGSKWAYNPVQGGDQYGNASRLIDVIVTDSSVYIKAQPQDWSLNNKLTPSYMENTYTLTDDYVRVDNRFVDFSGWEHRYAHQELPAFYTVSYLSRFTWYNGKNGWTSEPLSYKDDLQFWGDARYSESCRFPVKEENTETWCAWVSAKDDFGIGLFVPGIDQLYAGKFSYNGSKSATDGATNYVAPLMMIKMVSYTPIEYSYLITTGSVAHIREVFTNNKDFADNSSLKKNSMSMRVIDIDYSSIDFSQESSKSAAKEPNNTEISYNSAEKALQLRVTSPNDPQVMIDYTGSSVKLKASDYSSLEIVYKIPKSASLDSYACDLFLCTGSKMNPDGSERTRVTLTADGEYHTCTVDLASLSFWAGDINKIRFDYFDACAAGDTIYVKSFSLK